MKLWTTEIWAVQGTIDSPFEQYNKPTQWQGPYVPGISIEDAQRYCDTHGLGYCRVIGELIAEGPFDSVLDSTN